MKKPDVVSKARHDDFLSLVALHVRPFNDAAWRVEDLPSHGRILIDEPQDGFGYRIHLIDDRREIVVGLKPGFDPFTCRTSLLTAAQLAAIPKSAVRQITTRPVRKERPMPKPTPEVKFAPMTETELLHARGLLADLIAATPTTDRPVLERPGITLRLSGESDNGAFLEIGDDPCRLRVLILEAPEWVPWCAGRWTVPPLEGLRGEYSATPVFVKGKATA